MNFIWLGITVLSLTIWIYLLGFRGQFWRANQRLETDNNALATYPSVCAVIPARNEAEVLPTTLRSLLTQDYGGEFSVIVVDDHSTDQTAQLATATADSLNCSGQLTVLSAEPLAPQWTGKLWAIEQGISYAQKQTLPDYFLLTDADIKSARDNLRQLVTQAETEDLDLVSLMVLLRCESFWEKLLIPAFVFFFQKLYPFSLVNDPQSKVAAAAGGCILIRRQALETVGGISVVRQALIDDCALAEAVKSHPQLSGRIWLGLTDSTRSLRRYLSLKSIWDMVARTAFTQLNYSPGLLIVTVVAMTFIYLVAPLGLIVAIFAQNWSVVIASGITLLLMTWAYLPTVKLYKCFPLWALTLPLVAFLYSLMTLDSALRHWQGKGGAWKGRVYPQKS